MQDAISEFLHSPHTCLLIVSPSIQKLEDEVDKLSMVYNYPCLSVGQGLSSALLSTMPDRRSRAADHWVRRRLGEMTPDPILVTRIALLFEPSLALDPLRLMRDVSRRTRTIVAWPGNYTGDTLTYAVPAHNHYRAWREPAVAIARLLPDT